jgi:TP901 family phage tail tape measure protein
MGVLTTLLRFTGDASGAVRAMDQTASKVRGFSSKMSAAGQRLEAGGAAITKAGMGIGMMAAPAVLAMGGIIKTGLDLEQVMHQIEAVSGADEKALAAVRKEVLRVGKDLPLSTQEAAELAYSLATLGFTSEEVVDQLDGVGRLAVANRGKLKDLSQAGMLTGAIMRGFGLDTEKTNYVLDILTTATDKSAAEIDGLAYTFKYVAPTAGAAHQSLEDMTAIIAIMANVGIKGEMSGVALRNMITRLLAPSKKAAGVLEELGIQVSDSTGTMLPLTDIMGQFRKALKGATDEEKAFVAKTLVGEAGVAGFMAVVDAAPDKWEAMKDAMYQAADAEGEVIKRRVDIMLKGASGNIEQAKGSMETLAATMYEDLAPAAEKVSKALFDLVNWFLSLPPETREMITKVIAGFALLMGGLAAVLIPLGMIAMSIGALLPLFGVLAGVFGVLLSPVGLVIAAIVALVAIGVLVWKNWDKIVALAKRFWGWLKKLAGVVGKFIGKLADFFPPFKLVKKLFEWFTGKKKFNLGDLFDTLTDFLPPLKIFKEIWAWLSGKKNIKLGMNVIKALLNLPKLTWNAFVKALDWAKFIPDLAWKAFAAVLNWAEFIGKLAWPGFLKLLDWGKFVGKLAWSGFLKLLDWYKFVGKLPWNVFLKLLNWAKFVGQLAWSGFVRLLNWASYIGKLLWSGFINVLSWVSFIGNLLWSGFVRVLNWASFIANLVWSGWVNILNWGSFVVKLAWSGFVSALSWVSYLAKLAWSGFVSILSWAGFISKLLWQGIATVLNWANFIGNLVWSGIATVLNWAEFITSKLTSWISVIPGLDWAKFILDKLASWGDFIPKLEWPDFGKIFSDLIKWFFGGGEEPPPQFEMPPPSPPGPGKPPPPPPMPDIPSVPPKPTLAAVDAAFWDLFGRSGLPEQVLDLWLPWQVQKWLEEKSFGNVYDFAKHLQAIGYAKGGIIRKVALGLLGEAGPEAVMPLTQFFAVMRQLREAARGFGEVDWAGLGLRVDRLTSRALPSLGGNMSIVRELAALGAGGGPTYQLNATYREVESESNIIDDLRAMEMAARMRVGR